MFHFNKPFLATGLRTTSPPNLMFVHSAQQDKSDPMTQSTTIDPPTGVSGERRKRARMRLEFPVVLIPAQAGDEISGTTMNVSGDGFYCLVPSPAAQTGESLSGILALGVAGARQIRLFCDLRVVRVEPRQEGFGVACQIERYSVRAD